MTKSDGDAKRENVEISKTWNHFCPALYASNALLAVPPRVVLDDFKYVLHDSTLEYTIKRAARLSLLKKDAQRTNPL